MALIGQLAVKEDKVAAHVTEWHQLVQQNDTYKRPIFPDLKQLAVVVGIGKVSNDGLSASLGVIPKRVIEPGSVS